ncbi:MAG: hypothetical protein RLZZ490_1489, partial [Cyanobacteriota bacterium]
MDYPLEFLYGFDSRLIKNLGNEI